MNKKKIRNKGKLALSKYFQELKKGDSVSITIEKSLNPQFPKRLQGKTGDIEGKRGREYLVSIKEQQKMKKFLIHPIHLKKIKTLNKNDKEQ